MVLPARVSLSQMGDLPVDVLELLAPPVVERRTKVVPAEGFTKMPASFALAARVSRIMIPALASASVLVMLATRATIVKSPVICWLTNWKESALPQMSEPAPLTVNAPLDQIAPPARPTLPMPLLFHGAGSH